MVWKTTDRFHVPQQSYPHFVTSALKNFRRWKIFVRLIFVVVGHRRNIFNNENFPIYGIQFRLQDITSHTTMCSIPVSVKVKFEEKQHIHWIYKGHITIDGVYQTFFCTLSKFCVNISPIQMRQNCGYGTSKSMFRKTLPHLKLLLDRLTKDVWVTWHFWLLLSNQIDIPQT